MNTNKPLRLSRLTTVLGGFAAILLLTAGDGGCKKVKKPSSDSTPPQITWRVYSFATGKTVDYTKSTTVQAKLGAHYLVTLIVNDSGGVHEITLGSTGGWGCKSIPIFPGDESFTSQHNDVNLPPETRTFEPDSDGYVLTQVPWLTDHKLNFDCAAELVFSFGGRTLTATSKNYYDGVASSELTFDVKP